MKKINSSNGFDFIFIISGIFIASIFTLLVFTIGYKASHLDPDNGSIGVNGYIESRCISGHTFLVNPYGDIRQVMNSLGQGVECNE